MATRDSLFDPWTTLSADSLENITLKYICQNIDKLCYEVQEPVGNFKKLAFKLPVFLHEQLAESILRQLTCSGRLTLKILTLFLDKSTCRLRKACIQDSDIREMGIRLLLMHQNINDLDLRKTSIDITELLVNSLHDYKCTSHLRRLIISQVKSDLKRAAICEFKSLVFLDISKNRIDDSDLKKICNSLVNLEELNISCTAISDADSFGSAKQRLKCLRAYNCPVAWNNPVDFVQFTALQHLDISRNPGMPQGYDWPRDAEKLEMLLLNRGSLKELQVLDISGTPRVTDVPLSVFIASHPKLTFLGLCKTGLTSYADFLPKDIEITGEASEQQILSSLQHYPDRDSYMTESLRRLFHISKDWTEKRFEVLQLVLPPMEMHPKELRVQMASTACIFNLTRAGNDLHPSILGKIASLVLTAMTTFPHKHELIRNCLLIMDSKPMLRTAQFDYYSVCMSAMDALCLFVNDLNIVRLSTRICAILSAKISNYETIALGTDRHIKTLLKIVKEKVESKRIDYIFSVTLSVLWNLTDDAHCTCQLFVDAQGLDLFIKVLKEFGKESETIVKKVLGTLNNVAEVNTLRKHLITDECIGLLSEMLDADEIRVCYFAGGILANIILAWDPHIPLTPSKTEIIKKLEESVLTWSMPDHQMVAYRSFVPFLPLLRSNIPAIQLWATWGILHVCIKNASRYVPLLINDGVQDVIRSLSLLEDQPMALKSLSIEVCKKVNEYQKMKNTLQV